MKYILLSLLLVFSSRTWAQEQLNLQQVQTKLYGENRLVPNPESDLGRYLAETHASFVVRPFFTAPEGSEVPTRQLGPDRLVVAVSPDTFEAFKRIFSNEHYFYQIYQPNDVRMVAGFKGHQGTEGQLLDQIQFSIEGTLLTPILLDSPEADRMENFFALAQMDSRDAASPWRLRNASGEMYSAFSAFQGCTHWFGGIPFGNNLVDTYYFPSGDMDPLGENPNQKPLVSFETPGMADELSSLLHQVWTVPGHQQLGEVLKSDAFRRGEFTNPGWIAYTLLGSVSVERIPVVFVMVNDETLPLSPDFPVEISATKR